MSLTLSPTKTLLQSFLSTGEQQSTMQPAYLSVGIIVIQQVPVILSDGGVWHNPQWVFSDRESLFHLIQLGLDAGQVGQQPYRQSPQVTRDTCSYKTLSRNWHVLAIMHSQNM